MIVVDTTIIASMTFPTRHSGAVNALHEKNPIWEAPLLWRSEFLSVLALYYRKGLVDYRQGLNALDFAERLIGQREHEVPRKAIFDTMASCTLPVYLCEFVALARQLGIPLITYNRKLIQEFPDFVATPEDYLEQ